jgi:hypothetical protein
VFFKILPRCRIADFRTAAVVMAEAVLGSCRATPQRKIRLIFSTFSASLQAIVHFFVTPAVVARRGVTL